MSDKSREKACCDDKTTENKLVKATELPLHGNPYPPEDCITVDKPGLLENKVRAIRTTIQPYLSPICSAYGRTKDFVQVGVAHSQSAIQSISENQNSIVNSLVIATSGLIGVGLARKKGVFKKFFYGSVFATGAIAVCYPEQVKISSQKALYIAQNKLPDLLKQKYETISLGQNKQQQTTDQTTADKQE